MNLERIASRPVAIVNRGDTLNRAIQQMWRLGSEHLPVVEKGRVIGMLSERDLLVHACGDEYAAHELIHTDLKSVEGTSRVDAVMTAPVITMAPSDSIESAAQLMLRDAIHAIPLVNDPSGGLGVVNGIVTETDLLKCFLADPVPFANAELAQESVSEHMSVNVFSVHPDDLKPTVIRTMRDKRIRHVPVVDDSNHVLGILAESDVLLGQKIDRPVAKLSLNATLKQTNAKASDLMSSDPIAADLSCNLQDAAKIMVTRRIGCLPIVSEGKLVGILTSTDLLRAFLQTRV